MLGFLFGFNARIKRLQYFFGLMGAGLVLAVMFYAVTGTALKSPSDPLQLLSAGKGWPAVSVGIFFLWVSFTLQSMRFRDIGWDPVCIIPAWMALVLVDRSVAAKIRRGRSTTKVMAPLSA